MTKISHGNTQVWTITNKIEWQDCLEEVVVVPDGTKLLLDVRPAGNGQILPLINLAHGVMERGGKIGIVDPTNSWRELRAMQISNLLPVFPSTEIALMSL